MIRISTWFALCVAFIADAPAAPRRNQAAQGLASRLTVGVMDTSVEPGHLAELEKRLIPVLNHLQQSNRGTGPPPRDLLNQAYAMRNDVSTDYVHLAVAAIVDAWEAARWLGLFDEKDRFDGTIRKGGEVGQKAVFQYIVPAKYVPEFSRSFCNIEIVSPAKRRQSDEASALDQRVIAYGRLLREHAKRDGFVRTPAAKRPAPEAAPDDPKHTGDEHEDRWARLRAADPESAGRVPSVAVRIQKVAAPSRKSGGRYVFRVNLENRSSFPTEINFECLFMGKPKKDPKKPDAARDEYCYLLEKSTTFRLLPGEAKEFGEAFAPGNASYRGYATMVHFNGKTITTVASDARMEKLAEGW